MRNSKASAISIFALLAVSSFTQQATAQAATLPSIDAVFDRLSRPAFTNREFYDAVIAGKTMARTMGANSFCDAAINWSRDNSRGNQLLNVISSMVMGDFQLASQVAVYLDSPDDKLQKLATDYFAAIQGEDGTMSQGAERADALAQTARNLTAEPSHPAFQILFDKDPRFAIQRLSTIPRIPEGDDLNVSVHRIEFAAYYYRTDQNEGEGLQPALEALGRLTHSEYWWIRRYAAEMVRRYDAFRTADLLDAIRNDPVTAVATAVDVPFRAGMGEDEFREWKKTHPGMTGRY